MKYDELVNELDKVGVFRYAHEKAKGCEMVQCSIFKILAVVNLVEQATLERAAKYFAFYHYGEFYSDEIEAELLTLKDSND